MRFLLFAVLFLTPLPVAAKVHEASASGFVVRLSADVAATPQDAWRELLRPAGWWNKDHSYSGDVANISIEPMAGGCFCEVLPNREVPGEAPRGSVEHMRVVYIEDSRLLRMSGALGPLQSEAVQATLTVAIRPIEGGTRLLWEYVVGGFMRQTPEKMAPVVDAVLAQQLQGLSARLGPLAPQPGTTAPEAGR